MCKFKIPTEIKNVYGNTPITPNIPTEKANEARTLLRQHELRLHQLLFSQRLSSPGQGYPWKVQYTRDLFLQASTEYKGRTIFVSGHNPDDIYINIIKIQEAIEEGRDYLSFRSCCPLAVGEFCVCLEKLVCPVHGSQCYGSHD